MPREGDIFPLGDLKKACPMQVRQSGVGHDEAVESMSAEGLSAESCGSAL